MDFEIVFPDNNEEKFVSVAGRLGIKKLVFLYDDKKYKNAEQILAKIDTNIELEKGIVIKNPNQKFNSKYVVVKSTENDRAFIESKSASIIYGFEEVHTKDSTHQRKSNLNHIICQLAHEKGIIFGFSYSSIINSPNKATVIGRMKQNINLCKKYKVKAVFASFAKNPRELRNNHDVRSLLVVLSQENLTIF
jgi:RNase P/RNase MRP subunit p30